MKKLDAAILGSVLLLGSAFAVAADSTRQTKLAIAPGGSVSIVNNCGSVTLHQGSQRQVLVSATTH